MTRQGPRIVRLADPSGEVTGQGFKIVRLADDSEEVTRQPTRNRPLAMGPLEVLERVAESRSIFEKRRKPPSLTEDRRPGDDMEPEFIRDEQRAYCLIIPRSLSADETRFFTGDDALLQVGFITRPAGEPILRHYHLRCERWVDETWEFLWVRQGSMTMTIYNHARAPIAERVLRQGDAVLLMGGGHGFEPHEDLVLLEVKQGPYVQTRDKERF